MNDITLWVSVFISLVTLIGTIVVLSILASIELIKHIEGKRIERQDRNNTST